MESSSSTPGGESIAARAFQGSCQGILIARLEDGQVLEANCAFLSLLHRRRDGVVGRTMGELGLFADRGDQPIPRTLLDRGSIQGIDGRVSIPAGEARTLRLWAEVVPDEHGALVVVRASDADGCTTPSARSPLVEQIPAVVYIRESGEDGAWFYISPQLEQVLGYSPEEWLAHPHPMQSFVHPDDIGAVDAAEARSERQGDTLRVEYRIESKDGRWVWILDEASVVRGQPGEPLLLQGVMFDVTERKRAEFELASANEQLRALDRHKNTLLHTLSHDLRQPITAILGAAATLESLHLPEPERQSLLRGLQTRARGMDELITDLLDLDRLDRGITEPKRGPVNLRELVEELVTRCDCLEARRLEIECEPIVVAADRVKLGRVLENLIQNASRHTPDGSRVWIRALKQDGGALICVDDDGPGIPDELKRSVFEPLRRGPSAREVPGSGLGLSLVARFSELHGGRAWVEDRPGGGASFRVFLPDAPIGVS
ncbi:MAG: ATP-binding protein [Actinomycetota bacterium]